jgi:hypothetical protein
MIAGIFPNSGFASGVLIGARGVRLQEQRGMLTDLLRCAGAADAVGV